MKLKLSHVNTVKRTLKSGEVRIHRYHRHTGKKIEGSNPLELAASHFQAQKATDDTPKDTLLNLIKSYQGSQDFSQLAKSTQRNYRYRLGLIANKYGHFTLANMVDKRTKALVLEWRDKLAKISTSTADEVLRTFKALLSWASGRGIIECNILAGIRKVYRVDRSAQIWQPEHIAALLKSASPEIGFAIRLALLTGQRQIDLLKWRWADYHNGGLFLPCQQKTGEPVSLPAQGALAILLDSIPRKAETILTNKAGSRWTDRHFRAEFQKAVTKAAQASPHLDFADLHFHDLRGTAITALADAGCTAIQIAAFTGHSVTGITDILRKYLKRTTAQAAASMAKLGETWIGNLQTA